MAPRIETPPQANIRGPALEVPAKRRVRPPGEGRYDDAGLSPTRRRSLQVVGRANTTVDMSVSKNLIGRLSGNPWSASWREAERRVQMFAVRQFSRSRVQPFAGSTVVGASSAALPPQLRTSPVPPGLGAHHRRSTHTAISRERE